MAMIVVLAVIVKAMILIMVKKLLVS